MDDGTALVIGNGKNSRFVHVFETNQCILDFLQLNPVAADLDL